MRKGIPSHKQTGMTYSVATFRRSLKRSLLTKRQGQVAQLAKMVRNTGSFNLGVRLDSGLRRGDSEIDSRRYEPAP